MEEKRNSFIRKIGYGWLSLAVLVVIVSIIFQNYRQRKFDPNVGINLVVIGEKQLAIATVRKTEDQSGFVVLPEKMVVDIENSNTKLRALSLWGLGEIERKPGEVVMRNLGKNIGLGLTGYIKVGGDGDITPAKVVTELTRLSAKTNLSWWDRFLLRNAIKSSLGRGEMVENKLTDSLFELETDPDGEEHLRIDKNKLKIWAEREWLNADVLAERVNVAVFNNSSVQGKARWYADAFEIAGMKVVEIATDEQKTDKCEYIVHRENLEASKKVLENQFGCREGRFMPILGQGRTDIEVLTGEN